MNTLGGISNPEWPNKFQILGREGMRLVIGALRRLQKPPELVKLYLPINSWCLLGSSIVKREALASNDYFCAEFVWCIFVNGKVHGPLPRKFFLEGLI